MATWTVYCINGHRRSFWLLKTLRSRLFYRRHRHLTDAEATS